MIHYDLECGAGHAFDGWFKDSGAFDDQAKGGLLECPVCGGADIKKRLMAPAIPKKGLPRAAEPQRSAPSATSTGSAAGQAAAGPVPAQVIALLQRMRAEVEKNCDYVGDAFVEEARKMQRGESELRGIYGEASEADAETLRDEGIEVARIPWVSRADG